MGYIGQSVAYKRDASFGLRNRRANLRVVKCKPASVLGVAPFQAIMLLILLIGMISYLLYSKVVLDRVNDEIVKYQQSYNELVSEKVRLEVDMESKVSLKNIEEKAYEEGLCPIQDYQVEYVDFKVNDNIELPKSGIGLFESSRKFFKGILAYLK